MKIILKDTINNNLVLEHRYSLPFNYIYLRKKEDLKILMKINNIDDYN